MSSSSTPLFSQPESESQQGRQQNEGAGPGHAPRTASEAAKSGGTRSGGVIEDEYVLSVTELTHGLRDLIERTYGDLVVEGEISNFSRARSGHCYFSLKDADSQIRCCLWRYNAQRVFFEVEDGQHVRVRAKASVYPQRGDLQLIVDTIKLAGEGALQKAFEELKRALRSEGLFEQHHKRTLPRFPRCIGVVTSGSGAAIHDIRTTLERRFPGVRLCLCPVRVQGMGAAAEIARAIECLNNCDGRVETPPEVLIVGRGGGSVEDLWAFNEEIVARAIFNSRLPVISAVGHETDVSISDFVADVRAATPSIAAELAVPDRRELLGAVAGLVNAAREQVALRISRRRQFLERTRRSYAFRRPADMLSRARESLRRYQSRLRRETERIATAERLRLGTLRQRLELLDPNRPLMKGYVHVLQEGNTITDAAALAGGDEVTLRFHDGERKARIEADA